MGFDYFGEQWPAQPTTAFYDWLYLQALAQNPPLLEALGGYEGFTDIAFNPQKSAACQARCAAMSLGMREVGVWEAALESRETYLEALRGSTPKPAHQPSLF